MSTIVQRFAVAVATAVCCAATVPGNVLAQCTQTSEVSTLKKSIRQAVRCNDKIFRAGPGASCSQTAPPPCAGTIATDVLKLAYSASNNPPAAEVDRRTLSDQLRCQKQLGKSVRHYVATKMRSLITGRPSDPAVAEARATKQLDKIAERCAVTVAEDNGVVVPAVGPQCAAAVGAPGNPVDTTALRDCLHTLAQVWVDRWGPDPQPLAPNIIFILTDDQRWDTIDETHSPSGTYVMPRVKSELIDSGVWFTNAFMTTPLCCPSRSSLLAGQYAHNTGVYLNDGPNGGADDFMDDVSLGTLMVTTTQGEEYRTGFIGKYLNGYNQLAPYVPPGWSEWHAFKQVRFFNYTLVESVDGSPPVEVPYGAADADYSTDVLREKAKQFITQAVGLGKPFFLYLAFKAPHLPQEPAPRHVGMFSGLSDWRPAGSYNEPDVSDKPLWIQNTDPLTLAEQDEIDAIRISQLEMLQAVDEAIGGNPLYSIEGIMETLRDLGVDDNTMVIYFSDNGWHWGEHRHRAKNKPYEESIRAPMVVRYPKLAPLQRMETEMALNIDFCATFLELAGKTPPPGHTLDGLSLVRLLDGTAPTWRTDFMTEGWPGSHEWASVREKDFKYTELPIDEGNPATDFERELYNLSTDPLELDNLALLPEHAERITNMEERLRQIRPTWPGDSDGQFVGPDDDE